MANPANRDDLNVLSKAVKVQYESREHPEELLSRLRKEEADAASARIEKQKQSDHERRKDIAVYWVALTATSLAFMGSLWMLYLSGRPEAETQRAATTFNLIVGGLVGYVTGRAAAPKPGG